MSDYPAPALQNLPLRERPAYRITHVGAGACSVPEVLATVIGGQEQIELAHQLLSEFDDLVGLVHAAPEQIESIPGLGPASTARLKAALELGRRVTQVEAGEKPQVRAPADAAKLLMPEMGHLEQEHFVVLLLDTRNRMIARETLYKGSLNASHIRVGEVFREAVRRNCAAILVAHNHPSADVSPSPEDISVTRKIVEAGEMLDIDVLDHLVIGRSRFVSLRERGLGGWT